MTYIKDKDYEHSNRAGNGPAERMEGGDLTDDIEINDPHKPANKPLEKDKPIINLPPYKKP